MISSAPVVDSPYLATLRAQLKEAEELEAAGRRGLEEKKRGVKQRDHKPPPSEGTQGNIPNIQPTRVVGPQKPTSEAPPGSSLKQRGASKATADSAYLAAVRFQREEEQAAQSLLLAQQLQSDEQATLALIASFSKQEKFDCKICMDESLMDDVALLEDCGHMFCRDCLREYIGSKLGEGIFPIMCPVCVADKGEESPAGK